MNAENTNTETPQELANDEKETSRVEAFSDGVFAIAITLLILEIPVLHPIEVQTGHLAQAVLNQWPNLAAYLVSFIVILVMWLNHHAIFQLVRYIDRTFLILNGLLLLFVTFVNYPTALVADFLGKPDAQFAVTFYSGTFLFITIIFNLLWRHAASGLRLIGKDIDPAAVERLTQQYRFGPAIYLVAFIVSIFNGWVGLAMQGLLALYFVFTGQIGNTSGIKRRGQAKKVAAT